MTAPETRFERTVADLLADLAPSRPPVDLIPEAEGAVDEARRWPRWLAILKEPPMRHRSHLAVGSPTARIAALAAATLLIAVLGAGALVAGAQSPSPAPPEDASAPAPAVFDGTSSVDPRFAAARRPAGPSRAGGWGPGGAATPGGRPPR
jgi:hypothetical protein